jgi:D-alanyl-lipoteichoic acid acyltransferase DltB (MBOAT superfamily)
MHLTGSRPMPLLQVMLPVGISFYTFQNIGYTIDVYRKAVNPCTDIINYGLFISFFSKFMAGPIERASNLLKQINQPRPLQFDGLLKGLSLMLWGYFQKSVIADNISVMSNKIFLLEKPSLFILCAGAFSFTIQIYADFSGYTDIARGCAKLLGFDLLNNFNNPYFAKSPSDFWRRWHMSLSQWIRDYIYIPLGGSRVSAAKWVIVLFITFFLTGLWHGASWNYVLWGLYYWILYLLYRAWDAIVPSRIKDVLWGSYIAIPVMFILTNIGWLIFKETDSTYLWKYFTISIYDYNILQLLPALYIFCYACIYSFPLFVVSCYIFSRESSNKTTVFDHMLFRITIIPILLTAVLLLKSSSGSEFIYFKF